MPDARLAWLEALAAELSPTSGFFEEAPGDQRRALLEAAVTQTAWGELEHASGIVLEVRPSAAPGRSDIPSAGNRVRARRHILRVLGATAAPDAWHAMADLAERAMGTAPDFLIRRRLRGGVGGEDPGSRGPKARLAPYRGIRRATAGAPEPLDMVEDWTLVEGAFVAGFVGGPLHWLGLADLGGSTEAPLFRLTAAWASTVGDGPGPEDEVRPGRFFVQPNFEIMADGGGDNIAAIMRLGRVADLESFDRAALLRVTRESVLRGLESGLTREEILGILSDEGRVVVPQNVEYSLVEWAAAHDRYELRTAVCVLETDDPAELDALEEELPGCLERLGPTAARVPPERAERLEAALAERADVEHIDHAEGLSRVFSLDEKMTATPLARRWHWYPEHLLGQIAERQEIGSRESGVSGTATTNDHSLTARGLPRFRLTRESVRAGLGRGLQAGEVERFIESCADQELTARQRLLLRGWLGRYEPVQLASVTVLALPPEAVADVLALPELREHIAGWLSPSVFLVQTRGRAKVKRLLEGAGIEVGDEVGAMVLEADPSPASQRGQVEPGGRRSTAWGRRRWALGDGEAGRLTLMEEAVARQLPLEIGYASVVKGEPSRNWQITPHSIERSRWGQVRVHAYCHTRETERAFDLGRVTEIRVLGPR